MFNQGGTNTAVKRSASKMSDEFKKNNNGDEEKSSKTTRKRDSLFGKNESNS